MFKKIALAVALIAASSFATWDYYKVPEAGTGTVKGQFKYDTNDDWYGLGINASVRYVVIPNLELSIQSFGLAYNDDGHDWDGEGITDFTFGGRYQIIDMVSVFLDLNIPLGDDDDGGYIGSDTWALYFGGQFSYAFTPELVLGTEAGLDIGFEHSDYDPGTILKLAAELGYSIKDIGLTPFFGIQWMDRITEDENNENGVGNDGDTQFNLWIGASYAINAQMAIEGKIGVYNGDVTGDDTHIEVNFYYNF